MRTRGLAILACAAIFLSSGGYAAADQSSFCVTCKGPDSTYLCQTTHGRGMSRSLMKYACIVQLAKTGGHGSCAVSHVSADYCRGDVRQVNMSDLPGVFGGPAAAGGDQSAVPQPSAEQVPDDPALGDRPSVARMTKRAIRASRNGMANVVEARPMRAAAQRTGRGLGRVARCAGRLFWRCGRSGDPGGIEPLPTPAE